MGKVILIVAATIAGAAATVGLIVAGYLPGFARISSSATLPNTSVATTSSGAAASPSLSQVVALARLEPAGGIIELGGTPGDRVEQLLVHPGQAVKRDDELIRFESRTLRQWEQAGAKSQLAEATARLQAEQTNADVLIRSAQLAVDGLALDDVELAAQRTRLKALVAAAEIARHDYDRLSKLDADVTSPQELEHSRLMQERAATELAAAQDELKKLELGRDLKKRQAETGLDQAKTGRATVDATIPLESLRIAVSAADERLRLAVLRTPINGVVLETLADSGDAVGPTPLIRLADTSAMVAKAEVYETQVREVRVGQKCTITADALTQPLTGKVERISSVVGRNQMVSLDPRRSTDDRIVEVRIRLDNPAEAERFVNLQTTVTIDTSGK